MNWFRNLKISSKLVSAFLVVIALTVVLGAVTAYRLREIKDLQENISSDYLPGVIDVGKMSESIFRIRRDSLYHLLSNTREEKTRHEQDTDEAKAELKEALTKYETAIGEPTERVIFNDVRSSIEAYLVAIGEVMRISHDPGKEPEAIELLHSAKTQEPAKAMMANLGKLGDWNDNGAKDAVAKSVDFISDTTLWSVILLVACAGAGLAIALAMARMISAPLKELETAAQAMSEGSLDVTINYESKDELGSLATAVRSSCDALRAVVGELTLLIGASQDGRLGVRADATKVGGVYSDLIAGTNSVLENLADPIRFVAQNTDGLASSSEELTSVSQQLGQNATETSAQMLVVSAAAEEVSRTTQSIATATEEMGATIKEIAKSATDSARVAGQAVKMAETTNATVAKLGDSAIAIGKVIKVITSIAQQTNLLALNATIEAARAGEAGKGFAVVANEVKELAKETAKATEDIGQSIESIQTDTKEAVAAIATISGIIGQINDISGSIATAVEEQSATTNEMARNVTEAARGAGDIAKNITTVTEVAQSTSMGASQTMGAATDLARMTAELKQIVSKFSFDAGDSSAYSRPVVQMPAQSGRRSKQREKMVANG